MNARSWIFVGCYTRVAGGGEGIYTCRLDMQTGALIPVAVFKDIENPSFVTLSHDGQYLYSVIETDDFENKKSGGVAAFKINQQTGELTLLNQRASDGIDPCHISIDQTDSCILVSNYTGGSIAVFQINTDGSLSACSQFIEYQGSSIHSRQASSHAHAALISADNSDVFITDLGADCLRHYHLDVVNRKVTEAPPAIIKTKPGAGPRHMIFHPNQRYLYVLNELNNTVSFYDYVKIALTEKQVITTLPADFHGENIAADIHVTANGRFLYASNRGHDSLAIFTIDQNNGELTLLGYQSTLGKTPRNFFITPDDKLLLCANQDSNNIVSFWLDAQAGELTPTGQQSSFGKPVCIQMLA
jgi:6-phosphogluconolactonase